MSESTKRYLVAAFIVFVFLSFAASLGGLGGVVISGIAGWQVGDWALYLADRILTKT